MRSGQEEHLVGFDRFGATTDGTWAALCVVVSCNLYVYSGCLKENDTVCFSGECFKPRGYLVIVEFLLSWQR